MVLKLPIISKKKIAQNIWEVGFGLLSKDFQYKSGQYIKVTLPEVDLNHPKGNSREFSIIPSLNNKKSFLISFRESDSDFKQALLAHSINDLIKVSGPFGDLVLPKDLSKPIVMIAGGMGITAFLSMLLYLSEQKILTKIFLIYVNSKQEKTAYLDLLGTLKEKNELKLSTNKHFNFVYMQERLTKKQLASYHKDFNEEARFMIAGPPSMVRDTRLNLFNLGIKKDHVFIEEFTGYSG